LVGREVIIPFSRGWKRLARAKKEDSWTMWKTDGGAELMNLKQAYSSASIRG
jgi:hypothetical protein